MPPQKWRDRQERQPDRPSPNFHTSKFLDSVPIRRTAPDAQVSYPALGDLNAGDRPAGESSNRSRSYLEGFSPQTQPLSCSPTSSDIDALEASLYDLDLHSTPLEETPGPKSSSQNSSSADYIETRSIQTSRSQSSKSSSDDFLERTGLKSLEDRLRLVWPKCPELSTTAPLIVSWELLRTALYCDVDVSSVDLRWQDDWMNQKTFWTALKEHPAFKNKRLPDKADPQVWRLGLQDCTGSGGQAVVLTASFHLTKSKGGPPMRLELHPPKLEQSSRLLRRFGWDRFLEIRIPSVDTWSAAEGDHLAATVGRWLAGEPHQFLDRQWSAFYIRDRPLKVDVKDRKRPSDSRPFFYDRILCFAEQGPDFRKSSSPGPRTALSRNLMLDWLLNWEANGSQSCLKLFHRIALGLSKTTPVLVLEQKQIRQRSKDLKSPIGEVMNDGAGRISPSLMRRVRDELGLQAIPSAIQGRLGSAKGMWVVDVADDEQTDWIETWPSQRKWVCDLSTAEHRTLEVRSWSAGLAPASLNIQFLPILEDRAVNREAIRTKFVQSMTTEAEQDIHHLTLALQNPELFRKWVRDKGQQSSQRLSSRCVPFLGGLPQAHEDIMSFLVDGGFEPMRLRFLQDLVFQKMKQKGESAKQELKIRLGKSTYAYMLVDFWNVLEPDEVHLCFSSSFDDGEDELSDLDGMDVLVARSPAHLPSDIQKVRATFKPELRHLRDVIIFSAKGDWPLAAMLSGGDYDGDKAWVCWDRDIVNNFQNHSLPPKPDLTSYLAKDRTTLEDMRFTEGNQQYIDKMVEKAFCFNLRTKLLGVCTSYKERLSYHRCCVSDKQVMELSWLLSDLADQPKQGVLFGQNSWNRFRANIIGTKRGFPLPAYKSTPPAVGPDSRHIIDYLTFQAKLVVENSLTELHKFLESSESSTVDQDIVAYWNQFERDFGDLDYNGKSRSTWFTSIRDGLKSDVQACLAEWSRLVNGGAQDSHYQQKVKHMHVIWQNIKPRDIDEEDNQAVNNLRKILAEAGSSASLNLSLWELAKASWAFKHYHRRRFVWQMAGRQLQAIKAMASDQETLSPLGPGAPVLVVSHMYAALKPDNTYIKRLVALDEDEDGMPDEEPSWGLEALPWGSSQ